MKLGDNTLAYDVCVPLLYRTRLVLQLRVAVGRRGLGPRDQKEKRTQRAAFVPTDHTRAHTAAAAAAAAAVGHRAGLGCLVKKKTREAPRQVCSRPD